MLRVLAVLFEDVRHRKVRGETSTSAKASSLNQVACGEFMVSSVNTKVIVVPRCSKCVSDS